MIHSNSLRGSLGGLTGVVAVALLLMLAGCGDDGGAPTPSPTPTHPPVGSVGFHGVVYSGSPQTPIKGATITLYAMGYGGTGATALGTTTTSSSGSWGIRTILCPPDNPTALTYVTATGGDAGFGTNSAIGMMSLTPPCNLISTSTFVATNERTTVAAEWALAHFIGSDGQSISTSPTNAQGLSYAFLQSQFNLVPSSRADGDLTNTGVPAAFLPTAAECALGPQSRPANCDGLERINTLANIIGSCIDSSGPSSSQCSTLFTNTGNSTTTLQAAHTIVTNPMRNVAALFGLSPPDVLPLYAPRLASPPDGWELALSFTSSDIDFNQLQGLAIDSQGYVWVPNLSSNTITKLSTIGSVVGNFNPVGAYFTPYGIAIDSGDNVWVTNSTNSVTKLNSSGGLIGDFRPPGAHFNYPEAIAISPEGYVFVTNPGNNTVTALDSQGSLIAQIPGRDCWMADPVLGAHQTVCFSHPHGVAVGHNQVWVANRDPVIPDPYNPGSTPYAMTYFVVHTPMGTPFVLNLSPPGANFNSPHSLAYVRDSWSTEFFWFTNEGGNTVTRYLEPEFKNLQPSGANFNRPTALAVDSAGNVWVTNTGGDTVTELDWHGNLVGNFRPSGAAFASPNGIAIDSTGNVWVTNYFPGAVSVLIGAASPVKTPLVACLSLPTGPCLP